ncbi:MAG: hypothetical protein ACTMIA_08080 [Vibrio sp.]
MSIFRTILGLVFCWSAGAQAAYEPLQVWYSSSNKDNFTNETTYSAYGQAGSDYKFDSGQKTFMGRSGYSFGIRCDVSKSGGKDFMLTFSVDDVLATPNSDAYIYVKVDENNPIEFVGRLYTNSYKSGFVRLNLTNRSNIEKFVAQSISGKKMSVRVHDERRSDIENFSVLLRGFTRYTAETLKACGIVASQSPLSKKDRLRIKEIYKKISELEKEKSNILSKY